MNQPSLSVPVIGYHRSALSQKFGIPRQPNLVELPSVIEMLAPYNTADAFEGIEAFSHLWITWHTHHNYLSKTQQSDNHDNPQTAQSVEEVAVFKPKVRPPRLGGNTKLGVFATRSTYRPSQLGLSVVKLIKVEWAEASIRLHISGADMADGTPIIDIKPYIAYSDAIPEAVSGFAPDKPLLKSVEISDTAHQQLDRVLAQSQLKSSQQQPIKGQPATLLTPEDVDIIYQLIAQDPRPAYRQQQSDRVFYMRYKNYDIGFQTQNSPDQASGHNPDKQSSDTDAILPSMMQQQQQQQQQKLVIVSITAVN